MNIRAPFSAVLTLCALAVWLAPIDPGAVAQAQGSRYLSTGLTGNTTTSSNSFISFNLTSSRPIRLYRFQNSFGSTGTTLVDIWARPGGVQHVNTGWIHLGRANVNVTSTAYMEIPITLNFLMQPNQTWGFVISNHTISVRYTSGTSPVVFSDSHLTIDLTGRCAGTGTGDPTTGTTNFSFSLCTRRWCGAVLYDEAALAPNDAGISAITSPLNFCAGANPVAVQLENFGTSQLTSATIHWDVNGVTQPDVQWTGLLDTLDIPSRQTIVTLNPSMTFAGGTPYTIRAWTSMPNGVTDTVSHNDSTIVTRKAAMSGTFTVGGTSPDYPTLTAAVTDLNDNGVCGPVTLNVRPGIYLEQLTIKEIQGASSTNSITVQSETGVAADVTLRWSGSSTALHTLLLDGTDWLRMRDMTIQGTNTSYAHVVKLQGSATNNIFERCSIVGPVVTSTSTNLTGIYASGSQTDDNHFLQNSILNGGYGVYYYGSSTTALTAGTRFVGNDIRDFYYSGLRLYYQDAPVIENNVIETASPTTNYLLYAGYCQNQQSIRNNRITSTGSGTKYAMYVYYCTAQPGSEGLVANNMISMNGGSSTTYGMYVYYSNNQNVDFNTVYNRSTSTSSRTFSSYYGSNHRFTNNIAYCTGNGYAYYYYNTSGMRQQDYNVYFSNGTYLGYWNGTSQTDISQLQAASLMEAASIDQPVTFLDPDNGDLHLTGPSQNDVALSGLLQPEITTDIDGDPRVMPYRGADEACYILPNTVTGRFVDGNGQPLDWFEVPGVLNVEYTVAFPDDAISIGVTVNLYTVPGNQLAFTYQFSASKAQGQTLQAVSSVPVPPTLGTGYYRAELVFNTKNSCGDYIDYEAGSSGLLAVPQGQSPCVVWPGDVNNDGIVNYGDRSALNKYIFSANLRPSWLNGPARYRPDAATNPMTYYTWEGQPAAPWQTPEGCYMDADGNGVVNTYDLLVARVNWFRTHGSWGPKHDGLVVDGGFQVAQNYPNPFNPSTTLQYALPEECRVTMTLLDAGGRMLAELVRGVRPAGVHTQQVTPDAGTAAGVLYVRVQAVGVTSGVQYERTVPMLLAK